MAKQKRALPKRKPRDRSRDEESLLLRSAESLGRVIGSLQRQLDSATKRLSATAGDAWDTFPLLAGEKAARRGTTKKRSATAKRAGAKNTKGAAGTKAKKSAAAKKTRRQ